MPDPRFVGHRPASKAFGHIRVAMFVAALASFAQLYGIQPLMPTFAAEFGLDPATSALSMSLPAVGLGIAMLVAGPLSEVVGRTPLIHASLLGAAVIAVACGLAPSWPLLLVLRTAQGVALAGLSAVAMAYLSEEIHPESLARVAGFYVSGTALGGMSGRFVAGLLAQWLGWRGAIIGLGVLAVGAAVVVRLLLPGSEGFRPSAADPTALALAGMRVMRDPALVSLFAVGCTAMGTFVGLFNAVVFRLTGPPYGLPVGVVSLVFLVHVLGSASSARAGRLVATHGYRAVAPVGALILIIGVLVTLADPLPVVIAGAAIVSIGFFAVHGVAAPWVAARATHGVGATAQATAGYLFWFYLGSSVFGGLAPAAWTVGGWPLTVLLCAGLAVLTLALTLILRRIPSLREPPVSDPGVLGYS